MLALKFFRIGDSNWKTANCKHAYYFWNYPCGTKAFLDNTSIFYEKAIGKIHQPEK